MKLPGGMKPEGPMATGALKEKQHLQTDITLQPGKCYSILGFSKKVKDLDLTSSCRRAFFRGRT